jgi:hypothetical protein
MKRGTLLMAALLLLALRAPGQAQAEKRIVAEGGVDERAGTRVLYWDRQANGAAGQVAISYGRPVWKKAYDDPAKFDGMTKGKIWRLGANFWTTLDTDLPLNIAGKKVAPGHYYLGLLRSADGADWSLAFINPAGAAKEHLDAFDIRKAKVAFAVPVSLVKADNSADQLTITLTYPEDNPRNLTLKIAWGNLALSAAVKVELEL